MTSAAIGLAIIEAIARHVRFHFGNGLEPAGRSSKKAKLRRSVSRTPPAARGETDVTMSGHACVLFVPSAGSKTFSCWPTMSTQ